MLFNSFEFLIFFPIVVCLYYLIPNTLRQHWLLLASYYFYMSWNARYGLLIFTCTLVTYLLGIAIDNHRVHNGRIKNYVVIASIFSISVLIYYKYSWYLIYVITKILHTNRVDFNIILPVGISFYTFQSLGYVIDVYRQDVKAERNFFKYALFISFFPQLVAGPIERSSKLLHQLGNTKPFDFENFREGLLYIVWGFFLKLVVADRSGLYVDYVYNNISKSNALNIIIATILFAFQIYGDFGGYSAIAIGAAKILGIDLMENFNSPYYACSVADFWRRWHISLNTWFRDYLYIPLGGNRKGTLRKILNQIIVFGLSGLWHGASVTYMIWGLTNGFMVIVSGILKNDTNFRISSPIINRFIKIMQILLTFILVDFAWMFFRAQSMSNLIMIINKFSEGFKLNYISNAVIAEALDEKNMLFLVICIIIVMIIDGFKYNNHNLKNIILSSKGYTWSIVCGATIVFILIFGIWGNAYKAADFIYFQF
ncbi:MBOAT family O-acyltransferase [Butyrivibrio fibrisolvens]|uniref:MBOAT family O-acyltransferase n=1 Tax=Butyrivibrio fibrisolvens TaxID=831 RepID=UPI0004102C79|nr:MBOAT family O-acyltransferase [Butyrivibrio fibrisolvens]